MAETPRYVEALKSEIRLLCIYDLTFTKVSQGWLDAEGLDTRIDDLISKAEALGLERFSDPGWIELRGGDRYSDPDKPGKIVSYLEGYIQSPTKAVPLNTPPETGEQTVQKKNGILWWKKP
jgi:hypothetical protein